MQPMSRGALILFALALAAGLGLGLYIGWVVSPVQYVDAVPSSLHRAYKDDYVLMVATAYAGDGDLDAARAQLAALGLAGPAEAAVTAAAERLAQAGLPEADRENLAELAAALGAGLV